MLSIGGNLSPHLSILNMLIGGDGLYLRYMYPPITKIIPCSLHFLFVKHGLASRFRYKYCNIYIYIYIYILPDEDRDRLLHVAACSNGTYMEFFS